MLGLSFPDTIDFNVKNVLTDVASRVNSFFSKEHKADGTHSTITADTISVQGANIGVHVDLAWTTGRYEAAFTSGTWSITSTESPQKFLRYIRVGQLVFVQFHIAGTTIATDSVEELWIRLPELHAIPALNTANVAYAYAGGVCKWNDFDNDRAGIGLVAPSADDFSNTVPGTLLVVTRYYTDDAVPITGGLWQWPISTSLDISGSATFILQPNNTPSPYFGS